jgi:hypothetical protein
MQMVALTYNQIENIEKNLNVDWYKESYLYKESIERLMIDSLLNNRYLADQIEKSALESRMAFNTVNQLEKRIEKLEGDIYFLTGYNKNKPNTTTSKGVPIGRTNK